MIATKAEIDGWVSVSPIREVFRLPQSTVDNHAELKKFHHLLEESQRLHAEAMRLREETTELFKVLRENIAALSEQRLMLSSPQRRLLADVLSFDSKAKKNN